MEDQKVDQLESKELDSLQGVVDPKVNKLGLNEEGKVSKSMDGDFTAELDADLDNVLIESFF